MERLVSYATCPETPAARRRDANDAIEIFRAAGSPAGSPTGSPTGSKAGSLTGAAAGSQEAEPAAFHFRPVGLLMLVPADAV